MQESFKTLRDIFETDKQFMSLNRLIDFQKELLNHNIKALVGLRQETGYFTAETFIYNYEKLQLENLTLIECFLRLGLQHMRKHSRNQLNKDLIILIFPNQKYKYEF